MIDRRLFSILFATGLLVGLVGQASLAQSDIDPVGLRRAIEAQERNTDRLLDIGGVVGTAVGVNASGEPVIKVYIERSGIRGIPRTLDGHPVRVEVTGKIYALAPPTCSGPPALRPPECSGGDDSDGGTNETTLDPTSRFPRPVPTGVSTGHPNVTAGTICCRVTDGIRVYALSNNHVYADENNAGIGDDVLQPGPFDGGSAGDEIGTLSYHVPINFSTSANNLVDAAIAQSTLLNLNNSTPADGYGTPSSTTVPASLGMPVLKYGRTTGQTDGRVDAINATVNVGYSAGTARFVQQIIIRPGGFSRGGDSGSLIVTADGNNSPVGLLFAGGSGVTVANPIDDVLNAFGVTIDSQ